MRQHEIKTFIESFDSLSSQDQQLLLRDLHLHSKATQAEIKLAQRVHAYNGSMTLEFDTTLHPNDSELLISWAFTPKGVFFGCDTVESIAKQKACENALRNFV